MAIIIGGPISEKEAKEIAEEIEKGSKDDS